MTRVYRVLTGPTAAGKTAWLLACAAYRSLLVVSADSRQVYRHMDVGTGKPTPTEQKILPHYVIDCADPGSIYSVYQFLIDAAGGFRAAREQGRELWVCGGTGLFIRALVDGLELGPAPRLALRGALASKLQDLTPRQLAEALDLNPRDPDNPARVIRAAELACLDPARARRVYAWAGLPVEDAPATVAGSTELADARREFQGWNCAEIAVLDPGREALANNIERRTRALFERGLVAEVERLRELGYGQAAVVHNAIGYREAGLLLDGRLTEAQAVERTAIRTRQYAKRQRTYFRGRHWPVFTRTALDRHYAQAAGE
jgi:tRNA dimethylallyltransferase